MRIIGEAGEAIRAVQKALSLQLADADFRPEHREEILHVIVHETCHAAISQASPWIHELSEDVHTMIDEVAARVLETDIASQLQLCVHSPEGHSDELANYGLHVSPQQMSEFIENWKTMPHSSHGIDQLCHLIRTAMTSPG